MASRQVVLEQVSLGSLALLSTQAGERGSLALLSAKVEERGCLLVVRHLPVDHWGCALDQQWH